MSTNKKVESRKSRARRRRLGRHFRCRMAITKQAVRATKLICRKRTQRSPNETGEISSKRALKPHQKTSFILSRKFTFPNPDDAPACLAQGAVYQPVAGFVPKYFCPPICPSGFGYMATLGTAVPETSIHKDCQTHLPKYKIGFAEQRLIATPAVDAMSPEQFCQCQFCIFVAATANPRHPF